VFVARLTIIKYQHNSKSLPLAIIMNLTLSIFTSLIICTSSFAQFGRDTIISKHLLDSLHQRVNQLIDSSRKLNYKNQVLLNTFKIDTIESRKDSATINFYSKTGKLLKRVIQQKFKRDDFISLEKVEYFNPIQQAEFVE